MKEQDKDTEIIKEVVDELRHTISELQNKQIKKGG